MMTGDPVYDIYLAMLVMAFGLYGVMRIASRRFDRENGFDSKTGLPLPRKPDQ